MYDVPRSLQSWVSTIQTVVITADVFQLFTKTEKNNRTDYRNDTHYLVPTKKMKYFNQNSKVKNLTSYIHILSYEYEYFGSARTPVTKSSTRDHTASLLHTTYDEYVRIIRVRVRNTIHDCSYTRERIMSSVSPYSSVLWVTATISLTTCVQQMVAETR